MSLVHCEIFPSTQARRPADLVDGSVSVLAAINVKAGITAFAMEFMPRITRAQSMDVLSCQANLAGYQAVIDAAAEYDRALPMMMTAAGTVPAAKVFVMGVGVAGLQAIATARRLGAVVTATDVRPAAKEQVASLGAKFLAVEDEEFKAAETAGGYAKEMSKEYQAKQAALAAEHIAKQDIVITTALIPAARRRAGLGSDGRIDEAGLGDRRSGGRARRQCRRRCGRRGRHHGQWRQDRRPPQRAGPGRGFGLAALRQNLFAFLESMVDKDDEEFAINPRRTRQGDAADGWRQGRASGFCQGRARDRAGGHPGDDSRRRGRTEEKACRQGRHGENQGTRDGKDGA